MHLRVEQHERGTDLVLQDGPHALRIGGRMTLLDAQNLARKILNNPPTFVEQDGSVLARVDTTVSPAPTSPVDTSHVRVNRKGSRNG